MKEKGIKLVANNKKAYHDYFIEEKYEAGLVLVGTEVKSLRDGKCSIKESYVKVDKGLASLGGTILALDPKMFVVLLAIAIVLAVVINYICVVPMSISIVFALAYGYTRHSLSSFLILMVAAVVINLKHRENISRIKAGTEARFSLLWDRKSEAERLGKVYDDGKGFEKVEEKFR